LSQHNNLPLPLPQRSGQAYADLVDPSDEAFAGAGDRARGRQHDAQTRAVRAYEREVAANDAAERATTPEGRALHEREAAVHARAAAVHETAIQLQEEHIAHVEGSHPALPELDAINRDSAEVEPAE
jgi:hypothetical protein